MEQDNFFQRATFEEVLDDLSWYQIISYDVLTPLKSFYSQYPRRRTRFRTKDMFPNRTGTLVLRGFHP